MSTTAVPETKARRRAGRPRHVNVATTFDARDQILDAAGRLFVTRGFAATSTREIAEACGIRQASLYYHFDGKPGILAELLQQSVRPSLDNVERIELECPLEVPEAALYLLALVDVHTLATVPHNTGRLYRMPDVRNSDEFRQFKTTLKQLSEAYGRLGIKVANEAVVSSISVSQLGEILVQTVEAVIRTRANGDSITCAETRAISDTCLRVCGVSGERIERAAGIAKELLPRLVGPSN